MGIEHMNQTIFDGEPYYKAGQVYKLLGQEEKRKSVLHASIKELEVELENERKAGDAMMGLLEAAEAKLASVKEALSQYEYDVINATEAVSRCWAILSSTPEVVAVFSIPDGYTLLSVANDKQERIAFAEVESGGTVTVTKGGE